MQIFLFILLNTLIFQCSSSNSSCLPCTSTSYRSCYNCVNQFPIDRSHVEQVNLICNETHRVFTDQERFYSIIKTYVASNCTMRTFYFDQYTLWNYLESMSITYARLARLSPVIFNRSLSVSPILYSIKTLNFSHNSLRLLTKNFSYYFPSLEKLDLSYNQLILIRKMTFGNLIHLKELYLNNNHLKQILATSFPQQSLDLINLHQNHWHCSCRNALALSISRPVPVCHTPIQYRNHSAQDIARQCFFRRKANILITTNLNREENLTCTLSPTADVWQNKTDDNVTLLSAWNTEQQQPINIEHLYTLGAGTEKYLICFNSTSSPSEMIHLIVPLTLKTTLLDSMNVTRSYFIVKPSTKFTSLLRWLLNSSRRILPFYLQTSDKRILIIWLTILTSTFVFIALLIYFIYYRRLKNPDYEVHSFSNQFIRLDGKPDTPRTIFNMKINCKNHKCLCQYRRNEHSLIYSSNSATNLSIRPLLIQPAELRYAKIKRISSSKDLGLDDSTGHFRTIVKLKNST
ncbi:unnamed protein product [Adineta ricciae]|uniref:Uncharacterized protein n=1 Tax=Adineta ricciae TaxID=249248 RepID=A0A814KJ78_ADIRI|nr:unnamed protein product [Adineta ricciae]CAF1050246.1 unnamed protein product [Adineta ricciae]